MLVGLAIALLLGVAVTIVGRRGRRIDDHPLCRRCRFDLTGRPADADRRCPECGADLSPPRAVVVGHRQRRPVVLAMGITLAGLTLVTAGAIGYGRAAGVDWHRYAPVWVLLRDAAAADPSRRSPALAELAARRADGRLSTVNRDRVADAALAVQADPARPWDPAWGDFLESARAAGQLSDDRWHRYAAGSWPAAYQLRVRPTVRDGDPVPYVIDSLVARVGSTTTFYCERIDDDLDWPGHPPRPRTVRFDSGNRLSATANGGSSGTSVRPDQYAGRLPVGHHALHLRAAIRIFGGPGTAPPLATGTMDLSAEFDLVPADQPTVHVVHDPALADAVRRAVTVGLRNGTSGSTSPNVTVDSAPVGVGFQVFVKPPDGPEYAAGTVACPAAPTGRSTHGFSIGGVRPAAGDRVQGDRYPPRPPRRHRRHDRRGRGVGRRAGLPRRPRPVRPMVPLALTVAVLIGVALTIAGRRGRRTDDHPLCRRCRFDLTGRPDTADRRCPECGADLAGPRAVVVGHRRRRAAVFGVGVAVLTAAVVWGGVVGWRRAERVNWLRYATVDALVRRATSADPARRTPALAELAARFADGRLAGAKWDRTADAGLAYQGDPAMPWDPAWGDLLEEARAGGRLSDDRWARYAAQATAGVYATLRVRPRVRLGDPLPCEVVVHSGRVGRDCPLCVSGEHLWVRWGDEPEHEGKRWFPKRLADPYTTAVSFLWPADRFPPGLVPGEHAVHLLGDLWVGPRKDFDAVVPVAKVRLDLAGTTTVLPSTVPSLRFVADPSQVANLQRVLSASPPVHRGGNSYGTGGVNLTGTTPVGLAFAVSVRTADGREYPAGHLSCPAGRGQYGWGMGSWPTSLIGQPVDVILRADASVAADTVDVTQAWDGQIVIRNVR